IVPRLRTWMSPICEAASDRIAQDFLTSGEAAISACVVVAPISSVLPFTLIPERPAMAPRSTRAFAVASRNFMAGSRLWPPASSREPLCFLSSFAASASVLGRKYSKLSEYTVGLLLPWLCRADRAPDALGSQRHVDLLDAERREGVHHGVVDGRRRGNRPGLADALDAQRVYLGRRLRHPELEDGEPIGLRHDVVHHRARQQLPVLVVGGALPERLADALDDAAVDLALDDHGIDHAAAVVDGDVPLELDLAGLRVDAHDRDVGAE